MMNAIRIFARIAGLLPMAVSALIFLSGCGGGTFGGGAISGQVIAPADSNAPVYILAVKYENRGRVRKIETEKTPFNSTYVSAYTCLQSPGTYTIAGLEDGDYLHWAWMDMNANGGVEHLNFAEPVGWYQSDSNLAMNKLTIANGERLSGKDITLYRPTPFPAGDTSVAVGSGGGLLKTIKGNKTLVLWGTGQERAKAMGRLLAPQILDWINFVLIEHYAHSADYYENKFLATVKKILGGWQRMVTSFRPWWTACAKTARAFTRSA